MSENHSGPIQIPISMPPSPPVMSSQKLFETTSLPSDCIQHPTIIRTTSPIPFRGTPQNSPVDSPLASPYVTHVNQKHRSWHS